MTAPAAVPAQPGPVDEPPTGEAGLVWAWVQAAQAGDAEAFGLIYARYVDVVFRFVYFRNGNRQLAEDITADTFLRALRRIDSFSWQGRDMGAWLVTIARNLLADYYKSGRYRLEVTTGDVLDADRTDTDPQANPERSVVDELTRGTVRQLLELLNGEQRLCLELRFFEGLSVEETAAAMGKNAGAVKALQYRAVRAIARELPASILEAIR